MRRSAMRRVSSSCSPPRLKPTTAAALSDTPASSPAPSSTATSTRRTRATSSAPRALCSNTRIGAAVPAAGSAVTETDSAPAAISASISGCTSARAVAATVTTMRSAPACRGRAPAERGLVRAPGREPVDLRAHHAVEEFGGALRQFERAEQEARRLQHQLGVAAAQHGCDRCRDRGATSCPSAIWTRSNGRPDCVPAACDHERAVVLLDHLHAAARAQRDSTPTIAAATASIQRDR